jgi:hypothetical protein
VVTADEVGERCAEVAETTLFARARIVGVDDPTQLVPALESILFERDDEHDVIAMADGQFSARRARLGRGGIRALL